MIIYEKSYAKESLESYLYWADIGKRNFIICTTNIYLFKVSKSRYMLARYSTYLFYEQQGSVATPQSCLYFRVFQGSKLLNGCLVVWLNKQILKVFPDFFSGFTIDIYSSFPIKHKTMGFSRISFAGLLPKMFYLIFILNPK